MLEPRQTPASRASCAAGRGHFLMPVYRITRVLRLIRLRVVSSATHEQARRKRLFMPLLPPEPIVYPEGLLSNGAPAEDAAANWWVLHTKPRAEKSLARKCLKGEISF